MKISRKNILFDIVILFFILYAFRLPFIYNSTILALFLLICIHFIGIKNRISFFNNKYFLVQLFLYITLVILIVVTGFLHNTFDFSKFNVLISQFFSFICVLLLFNKILYSTNDSNNLRYTLFLLFSVFFIQSIIIYLAFFNVEFRGWISQFQANVRTAGTVREGVRALSLAGGQYFTLSALFCVLNVCSSFYLSKYKKLNFYSFFILQLFFVFSSTTAGRIYFISLPFAFFIYFAYKRKYSLYDLRKLIMFVTKVIITYFLVSQISRWFDIEIFSNYIDFVFEFLINYQSTGKVDSESTNILMRMYFDLDFYSMLYGDGMYANSDGTYYKHTDAGYMRNILYYGLLGLFLNFSLMVCKIYPLYKNGGKVFCFIIFILLSLLHIKGEAVSHIIGIEVVLFLLFFSGIYEREKIKNIHC